jgi:hypothetical protein
MEVVTWFLGRFRYKRHVCQYFSPLCFHCLLARSYVQHRHIKRVSCNKTDEFGVREHITLGGILSIPIGTAAPWLVE